MTTLVELNHALHSRPDQTEFWRQAIRRNPEPTALPRDYLGQDRDRPTDSVAVALEGDALADARRITRGDPTLNRVLHLAVLAVVAARATDSATVWVTTPAGGSLLPLAITIDPADGFRPLLSATRAAYLVAVANLDVPVGFLFEEAGLVPSDMLLTVDGEDGDAPLCVRLRGDSLDLVYRTDLFTEQTARRLAAAYEEVFASVVGDVGRPLGPLLAASAAELAALTEFNDTAAEFPDDVPLHSFLTRQARSTPDQVAIVDSGTTFAGFDRAANRVAHRLIALGVRRGDVVGVCLPRSELALAAIYAVLKAGAAYLPIDPALPPARIQYLVEHSGTRVVLGNGDTHGVVASAETFVDLDDPAAHAGPATDPDVDVGADDLCYVIYTSGSTGRPKGVMVEHRAIVNRINWMQRRFPLGDRDVILHKTPTTFDVSVWEVFWWSMTGSSVATLPAGVEKDPERIAARIAECGVTTMHFVPSMLRAFLRFGATAGLGSLRRVFASGEALAAAHVQQFDRLIGQPHGTVLINLYGPTEAAVDVTCFECAGADPHRPVPIGEPIDNIRIRVSTRSGALAPIGTPGELCIAGVGLARGYRNAPELTEERFVPDAVAPGKRMYRTGDLARWLPEGTIEYLGRIDTQVKIRGYRIELEEIEHVAARHPGVSECAVAAMDDGSGDRALCAYVVPAGDFHADGLRALLASELPSYMVPQFIVTVPAIPTNHNGKRDIGALPAPRREGAAEDYVAPRDETERQLAEVLAWSLGVARVGVRDNFFTLGGDSIKFIGVLAAAREAGLEFTFQDLFANPVIEDLAAVVRAGRGQSRETGAGPEPFALLTAADRDRLPADAVDAFPMSTLQAGLCFEQARREGKGIYHDVASYRVPDRLDVDTFRAAVAALVDHHEILRTSFHVDGFTEPIQIVHERVGLPLRVVDLTGLSDEDQDAELARFPGAELAQGFLPGATDLVRIRVHLLGERGYQYTLSYHAAALDGWSVSTLHRDLFQAYRTLLDGRQPSFKPCDVSYRDFIRQERDGIASPDQQRFWLDFLAGGEATRVPQSSGTGAGVVFHDVELPTELAGAVVRTAAELRVPVKSVLLAAHVAVLGFVSGSDDVLTGYEHSGRPEAYGAEHLAGLFLNTIPFRVLLGDGTWADLVQSVYRAEIELLPHRRYPMAEMKKHLATRETPFEAIFNFTHFHVLKELDFDLVRSSITSRTEFPFRAEFWQDALTDNVRLALHYDAAMFAPDHIERIGGYYVRAIELLAADVGGAHNATSLLGAAESALLARRSSGPELALPDGTMLDGVAAVVRRSPDRVALSDGVRQLTYGALDRESDRVAVHLWSSGVRFGDVVGVAMDRGLPWAVSLLAVMKVGGVYLPLDPDSPVDRLNATLRRADCRHVVVAAGRVGSLPAAPSVTWCVYEDAPRDADVPAPSRRPGPHDAAYILFTSGSTGEPKGAVISHLGMLNHLMAKVSDLRLAEDDTVVQVASHLFDISVWQLVAAWLVGGRTVITVPDVVTDLTLFLDVVRAERATVVEVVPSYLDALLTESSARPAALDRLRWMVVTGEACPPALTRRWFARYDVPVVNAYGPTEASDDVTHHIMTGPVDADRVPAGRPIGNTGIHVVRTDDRPAPIGSYGEICVTGLGVGLGYVNDPDRTAEVFRPNTFDDRSELVYHTGDVGRWLPDGTLDCAGRIDQQVKVRGFRIELTEIDGALARLAGIEHAATVVAEDSGDRILAGYYTGTRAADRNVIRAELAHLLPR
ncbi:MAG TPA: amino acid adenylation domain-containing protein, partial [Pseudonocardiaceae bacterium]|nr:amino acid adenylation domain-containing protein [Pseudonocardiaceae bacterium]